MNNKQKTKINYQKSGVSIDRADKLISSLKSQNINKDKNVLSNIGGFSSLYKINTTIKDPVIVSGTDGVGTKLKIANKLKCHKHIGQDLVAMCVNDIITSGAKPLFFLDYLATSKIKQTIHSDVLRSIKNACLKCEMSLIGGETAEMPGIYQKDDYDLAGFCVGIVSQKKIITPKKVKPGNIIIGLPSSGFHSNGFSLINKLIDSKRLKLSKFFQRSNLGNILIKPTRLYFKIINSLQKEIRINGLAHITGGGITDNVPRILPDDLSANISLHTMKIPNIFRYIQDLSRISDLEMLQTFNCGIGMTIIVDEKNISKADKVLKKNKYPYKIIGHIIHKPSKEKVVYVD